LRGLFANHDISVSFNPHPTNAQPIDLDRDRFRGCRGRKRESSRRSQSPPNILRSYRSHSLCRVIQSRTDKSTYDAPNNSCTHNLPSPFVYVYRLIDHFLYCLKVYGYDPVTREATLQSTETNKLLMRRYTIAQKARDAEVFVYPCRHTWSRFASKFLTRSSLSLITT